MRFEGLRDYRTGDSGQLREDLQRQNIAVGDSLAALERERAARPASRSVAANTVATHDEALIVTESCRITLPPSDADRPFRTVTIVVTSAALTITVAAAAGQRVMNASEDSFGAFLGIRRYEDDGQGGWWRAP